jgi:DNA-binding protein HU-beta
MNTLTKDELAHKLAEKTGMTAAQAHEAITHTIDFVQAALVEGRKVEFRGFGNFIPKVRAGRTGRNPRTPEAPPIQIPPKTVVKFKVGSLLSAALNPQTG